MQPSYGISRLGVRADCCRVAVYAACFMPSASAEWRELAANAEKIHSTTCKGFWMFVSRNELPT